MCVSIKVSQYLPSLFLLSWHPRDPFQYLDYVHRQKKNVGKQIKFCILQLLVGCADRTSFTLGAKTVNQTHIADI